MTRTAILLTCAMVGFVVGVVGYLAHELLSARVFGYTSLGAITTRPLGLTSGLTGAALASY